MALTSSHSLTSAMKTEHVFRYLSTLSRLLLCSGPSVTNPLPTIPRLAILSVPCSIVVYEWSTPSVTVSDRALKVGSLAIFARKILSGSRR